jgi:hypothetical protein
MYAMYVFDSLVGVGVDPARGSLQQESWVDSEYFASSSSNVPPPPATRKGWTAALWEIRAEMGADFTDRAVMYGIKSPSGYSDDFNQHLRGKIQAGVLVVKNNLDDYIKVNMVLERYSLLE